MCGGRPAPSPLLGLSTGARRGPWAHTLFSPAAHRAVQRAGCQLQRGERQLQPAWPEWGTGRRVGGSRGGHVERGHPSRRKWGCPARPPLGLPPLDSVLTVLAGTPRTKFPPTPPFHLDRLLDPTARPFRPWLPQLPTAGEPHTAHDSREQRPLHVHQPGGQVSLPARPQAQCELLAPITPR